jgi:ligand-binding sensor domain-containing protein
VRINWLLLLTSSILSAQESLYSNYTKYTVEEGLPQSFVTGITQDHDGFIWVSTMEGLARFDGTDFRLFQYNPKNNKTIAN